MRQVQRFVKIPQREDLKGQGKSHGKKNQGGMKSGNKEWIVAILLSNRESDGVSTKLNIFLTGEVRKLGQVVKGECMLCVCYAEKILIASERNKVPLIGLGKGTVISNTETCAWCILE